MTIDRITVVGAGRKVVRASGHATSAWSVRGLTAMLAACAWIAGTAATAFAGDDARPLLDKFKERDRTDRHWTDRVQSVSFDVHDGAGSREKALRLFEKRAGDGSRKLLARVMDPASQRGLGILLDVAPNGAGKQWLYRPAFKRTQELGDGFREKGIVDSDLTHDDLELVTVLPGWGAADAESHRRGSEPVDGEICDVIDLEPTGKGKRVPYKRITIWLGQNDVLVHQLEFSLDGTVPTKRITQTGFKNVGRVPVAHDIKVETLGEKSTSTDIKVTHADFDIGIGDECFNQSTLADPGKDSVACGETSK